MALGKPVLAFAVGGIPEIVAEGASGLLVSGAPPDVAGLASGMLRYLRDPDARRRHGAAGRRYALEHLEARVHAREVQSELVEAARS
jgi:glycosyltransferase involved in cell wall biosynthesis